MKSWHPSLASFNPFVIVFFLFRRLAKRAAPVKKTNDYDIYNAAYPGYQINGPTAEYVQLFSWSVVASILNCFYRIFIKKRKRKDPSRAIYTRLWTLLSEKLGIKTVRRNLLKIPRTVENSICLFRSVAKMFDNKGDSFWVLCTIVFLVSKGQLISKGVLVSSISSKKRTKTSRCEVSLRWSKKKKRVKQWMIFPLLLSFLGISSQ